MRELLRSNDPVLLSFIAAVLNEGHIRHVVLDSNMSVLDGSVGILPRRVMVVDADWARARQLLKDADLADELREEDDFW